MAALIDFDASAYLRKATSRAKSDVANKLVSMFLHEVSRKACAEIGLGVTDLVYTEAVVKAFGSACAYCGKGLEKHRAAVEHLEGMNRFRVGLHIPGNVIIACIRCNLEKRRDDSLIELSLADDGWQSFLSHNASRCVNICKTCTYWQSIWPEQMERTENMSLVRGKISRFRSGYPKSLEWSRKAKPLLRAKIDSIYRECQEFATGRIKRAVDELFRDLHLG